MKREAKAARVVRALLARGMSEISSKTRKYRTFVLATSDPQMYYFVGKAGALRKGSCASKSHSLDLILPAILAKYAPLDFETKAVAK